MLERLVAAAASAGLAASHEAPGRDIASAAAAAVLLVGTTEAAKPAGVVSMMQV
jgi:hypothetical protein